MGCNSSKIDDLPAVALCRQRCSFLDEAIHQRYALAEAHLAYTLSLKSIAFSLNHFFHQQQILPNSADSLKIPVQRKADPNPTSHPLPPPVNHSKSNSGSHLEFNSDSDDDSASDYLHEPSPSHNPQYPHHHLTGSSYMDEDGDYNQKAGTFMNFNYMRKQPTSSVVYQQRPVSPNTVQFGNFPYNNNNNDYAYNDIPTAYPPYYNNPPNYGGFFGGSPPPQLPTPATSGASSSKQPPPPPSPPRASPWDFLNPFETFEKFYPTYTPSRDSKELREEEGIPDLEDEDYQHEVVKQVHGNHKYVDHKYDDGNGKGKVNANESEDLHYRTSKPSVSIEDDAVEYEVHMVDKKVVDKDDNPGNHRPNASALKAFHDDSQVMKEIQVQFERASESGNELANMLETGKQPYNRKHAAYQAVSSKMLNVVKPSVLGISSQPSTSVSTESNSSGQVDPAYMDINDNLSSRSRNLSSTLQKLFLWEKKLYDEVRVEEKMRILHERKCEKLKHLDERGAEAQRVDKTRILVRSLSTKIRIAIQVVDKISETINKLRDDDLWPQLNEFINGLTRMWRSMLECHHNQSQAMGGARKLDAIASRKHFSDASLEATMQLEHELLNWVFRFSCWVGAQKGYVKALNNWLLKCLLYVPEETPDGTVPFSPGRIGAPPVFVVCNQWSLALDDISEKEVVESMRDFATSVLQLWERDKAEMRQRMMANREMDNKVKNLEREDQKIHKEIQALDKRIVMVSGVGNRQSVTGQMVYQSETSNSTSFQLSMQRIFEAMEKFAAGSMRVYEELLQRIEELRLAEERDKVS